MCHTGPGFGAAHGDNVRTSIMFKRAAPGAWPRSSQNGKGATGTPSNNFKVTCVRPGFRLSRDSVRIFCVAPGHRGDAVFGKWKGRVRNSCHPLEPDPAFPKTVRDMEAPQCHRWKIWGWWNSARCSERLQIRRGARAGARLPSLPHNLELRSGNKFTHQPLLPVASRRPSHHPELPTSGSGRSCGLLSLLSPLPPPHTHPPSRYPNPPPPGWLGRDLINPQTAREGTESWDGGQIGRAGGELKEPRYPPYLAIPSPLVPGSFLQLCSARGVYRGEGCRGER